jgi:hypothetical protein
MGGGGARRGENQKEEPMLCLSVFVCVDEIVCDEFKVGRGIILPLWYIIHH